MNVKTKLPKLAPVLSVKCRHVTKGAPTRNTVDGDLGEGKSSLGPASYPGDVTRVIFAL